MLDNSLDRIIKKHIVLTALTGIAVVLLMITVTYGLYQVNHENTSDQEITLGDFDVDLTSASGQITLSNLNPGVENETTYTFTTSNSGDYIVKYNVYFTDNTTTFLADGANAQSYSSYSQITSQNYQYIEYKLDNEEYKPLSEIYNSTTKRFTIITGRLQPSTSFNHSVKFRVSSSAPNSIQGSILALNITMEASAAEEVGTDTIMKLIGNSSPLSTDVITGQAPTGETCTNTLAYDNTADNSLRYVGANPCNYVSFNNESWRIIGVMNNVDDGTGKTETRLKLVRKDPIGNYSWDTSASSVNEGKGLNNWTESDLMQELNGDYLDTTLQANQNWYNGLNNQKTGVFDYTKVLSTSSQNLIDNAKWYLGKIDGSQSRNSNASELYTHERTANNSFGIYTWTGKVAVIYVSDYAYSVGGESRNSCIADKTYNYNLGCKNYTWFLNTSADTFTISPGADGYPGSVITYYRGGNIDASYFAYYDNPVSPTVYLKSNVKIISGNGTPSNMYILK